MCLAVPVRDTNPSARSVRESISRTGSFTTSNHTSLSTQQGPSRLLAVQGEPAGSALPPGSGSTPSESQVVAARQQHQQLSGADGPHLSPARQNSPLHQPHSSGAAPHARSSSANESVPTSGQNAAMAGWQGPSSLGLPGHSPLFTANPNAVSSYTLAPSPGSSILGTGSPHRIDSSGVVFPAAASPGTIRGIGAPGRAQLLMGVEAVHAATTEATEAAAVSRHVRVASPPPGSSHAPAGWQHQQFSPRGAARPQGLQVGGRQPAPASPAPCL